MKYFLSEHDYRRLQGLFDWYERNKRLQFLQLRRHRPIAPEYEGRAHKAYCKVDSGAAATIVCYLDTAVSAGDTENGEEITVYCSISGGGYLNSASRRLAADELIQVAKFGDSWHYLGGFQRSTNHT